MNGKRLGPLDNAFCSPIFPIPVLYVFGVGLYWQAVIRIPTGAASSIVVMLVAALALVGSIALFQR